MFKQKSVKITLLIIITGVFTSCNTIKHLQDNDYLLDQNTVKVNDKTNLTETVNNLLYQKENSKLLGIPLKLHIYNSARKNRDSLFEAWLDKNPKRRERLAKNISQKQVDKLKENVLGFNSWLKKIGEEPAIVNDTLTAKSVKRLEAYFWNNGWFNVEAEATKTTSEDQRASITYNVTTGDPYRLDSITTAIASPIIDTLYHRNIKNNSLLKAGNQYKTTTIESEQDRITNELRNNGIYHFNKESVYFEIDTIGKTKKARVEIQLKNRAIRAQDSTTYEPFKQYSIKKVNVFTDGSYSNRNKKITDSANFRGFNIYSIGKMRYRPKALTDAIFIGPTRLYKDTDRAQTYKHLSELKTFKYPNIEYVENKDTTLTANIYLTPLKKFDLGFSAEVSQSNIQTIGISFNPSLKIRNVFRGAEILSISGFSSIGSSIDPNEDDPFFDINELGIDLNLSIPRIFSPFNTKKIIRKHMLPSTKISLSATSQTNIGLDKQAFQGIYNFNWKSSKKVSNYLDFFNIQYVKNLNVDNYFGVYQNSYDVLNSIAQDVVDNPTYFDNNGDLTYPIGTNRFIGDVLNGITSLETSDEDYISILNIDQRKKRLTEENLILATNFNYVRDGRESLVDNNFSIFRVKLELAGNVLNSLAKGFNLQKDENDQYKLFDVAFSQYIKPELDYIKHWELGNKNILAMRSFVGVAIPFGNSTSIPFSKSFFAGGANDNRAWTAYSLGPGSLQNDNEFNEANLKIALGLEQRFNIFGNLNGALFIDAGNIWNVLDDQTDDAATFSSFKSLQDIAVGSGFGLRYDFSFFVFRFDVGFKTYDPYYELDNRWFNEYNFANAVYNIGINYPF